MLDNILSWDTLWYILLFLYIPSCLGLVIIVLLQKGKGAGFAGSFGMGAGPGSETVFGPRAGQTLPVKMTYFAAVVFVLISLGMSLIAGRVGKGRAPELVEGAEMSATGGVSTALDDLGLGKNKQGAKEEIETPAPAATTEATPATTTESPAADAEPAPADTDNP